MKDKVYNLMKTETDVSVGVVDYLDSLVSNLFMGSSVAEDYWAENTRISSGSGMLYKDVLEQKERVADKERYAGQLLDLLIRGTTGEAGRVGSCVVDRLGSRVEIVSGSNVSKLKIYIEGIIDVTLPEKEYLKNKVIQKSCILRLVYNILRLDEIVDMSTDIVGEEIRGLDKPKLSLYVKNIKSVAESIIEAIGLKGELYAENMESVVEGLHRDYLEAMVGVPGVVELTKKIKELKERELGKGVIREHRYVLPMQTLTIDGAEGKLLGYVTYIGQKESDLTKYLIINDMLLSSEYVRKQGRDSIVDLIGEILEEVCSNKGEVAIQIVVGVGEEYRITRELLREVAGTEKHHSKNGRYFTIDVVHYGI